MIRRSFVLVGASGMIAVALYVAATVVGAALLVASGPVAAVNVGGPMMGLFERITIGSFLVWVCVVSAGSLTSHQLTSDPLTSHPA